MSTIKKLVAVIYKRVSSQDQIQGTSLNNQDEACHQYAKNKNMEVADVFTEEGESATAANRTQLIRALDYCRKNKGKVSAFIVWKVDRFARNAMDHYALKAQLLKYGVTLHSVTETMINDDEPMSRALEGMLATFAQLENDVRKMRCEGGMHRRITEGIWPWHPPIGYLHSKKRKDKRKTMPDEIDPQRFHLIQKGLKAFARGEHTVASLTRAFNQWGLKTRTGKPMFPQLVERMLKDKFFTGILVSPWDKKAYQGLHQPMVTSEEHNQILFFKSGKSNNATAPRLILHPDFPLRGFVYCLCGKKMTASWQTGRSGKKHPYYRCNNPVCEYHNRNVKKSDMESKFINLLSTIKPDPRFIKAFEEVVLDVWRNDENAYEIQAKDSDKEIKKFEARKKDYIQQGARGEIRPDILASMVDAIENQITGLKISHNKTKTDGLDLESAVAYAKRFIEDPAGRWQNLREIKRKQRFQQLVLPKGLIFDRANDCFGTAILSQVFELSRSFDGNKTHLVAGVGFEPTTFRL